MMAVQVSVRSRRLGQGGITAPTPSTVFFVGREHNHRHANSSCWKASYATGQLRTASRDGDSATRADRLWTPGLLRVLTAYRNELLDIYRQDPACRCHIGVIAAKVA